MYQRARVAISTPKRNDEIKDPGRFSVHIGHARTLYLGSQIAEKYRCPFDVRLDGSFQHYGRDLSKFVLEVRECLEFLGIRYRKLYWQPQELFSKQKLSQWFTPNEQALIQNLQWDKGITDIMPILDDIEHSPTIIIRGNEFFDSSVVGTGFISEGIAWHRKLEDILFGMAKTKKMEINVPIITMGGYKMSTSEGRQVHWEAIKALGRDDTLRFFDDTSRYGGNWEWDWEMFAGYVVQSKIKSHLRCSNCRQQFHSENALLIHQLECERRIT